MTAPSPASLLRAAAAKARERAGAASTWDGYWQVHPERPGRVIEAKGDGWDDAIVASCIDYGGTENGHGNAAHIAAADPTFMLTVADWWEAAADSLCGCDGCATVPLPQRDIEALAAARAYLRSEGDLAAGGER